MLRITIDQNSETVTLKLEGRIAGPWVAELTRVWAEVKPELKSQKLIIDLKDTTYADAAGVAELREICASGHVELLTNSPWTQYLAQEVSKGTTEAGEDR